MTELEKSEIALAKAEARLALAASEAAASRESQADANAMLDKARAHCLQARAALREFSSRNPSVKSHQAGAILTRQLAQDCRPGTVAEPRSNEKSVPEKTKITPDVSGQGKWRFKLGIPAQQAGQNNSAARPQLLRQTIAFLALVLAYLQYFHFDVQLRILSLPSVVLLAIQ
jgi:hypothetical protein